MTPTHQLFVDVHIFDTDCYGVMWHGAYVKWLEMGRVELLKQCGLQLTAPSDADGFIYPVVNQSFRFRAPGRLNDRLQLTTTVAIEGHKLVFTQYFTHSQSNQLVMEAETTCVVLNPQWKPYRKIPEVLASALLATP